MPIILDNCIAFAFGRAEAAEIDEINILQATLLAMQRAVTNLAIAPSLVLVDGNRCPNLAFPTQAIINGDATCPSISAASIIAKVVRDREMDIYDYYYPNYGFAKHKGYGTKLHIEAIKQYGYTPLHRRSFSIAKAKRE